MEGRLNLRERLRKQRTPERLAALREIARRFEL
jgi:hypothetical protein